MSIFQIESTSRTPQVNLDYSQALFSMSGESYPEDAGTFYAQIFAALDTYFKEANRLKVEMRLIYFNSSSARELMDMMDYFEGQALKNCELSITWFCHADDDITREFVEDLASDYQAMTVQILDL